MRMEEMLRDETADEPLVFDPVALAQRKEAAKVR